MLRWDELCMYCPLQTFCGDMLGDTCEYSDMSWQEVQSMLARDVRLLDGADDHVSVERMVGKGKTLVEQTRTKREQEIMDNYKQIETLAYKYFDGEITDKRMAEAVFGLINEEAKLDAV